MRSRAAFYIPLRGLNRLQQCVVLVLSWGLRAWPRWLLRDCIRELRPITTPVLSVRDAWASAAAVPILYFVHVNRCFENTVVEPVLSCSCKAKLDNVKDTCCVETFGGLLVSFARHQTFNARLQLKHLTELLLNRWPLSYGAPSPGWKTKARSIPRTTGPSTACGPVSKQAILAPVRETADSFLTLCTDFCNGTASFQNLFQ